MMISGTEGVRLLTLNSKQRDLHQVLGSYSWCQWFLLTLNSKQRDLHQVLGSYSWCQWFQFRFLFLKPGINILPLLAVPSMPFSGSPNGSSLKRQNHIQKNNIVQFVMKQHGSTDCCWLRETPPRRVKRFIHQAACHYPGNNGRLLIQVPRTEKRGIISANLTSDLIKSREKSQFISASCFLHQMTKIPSLSIFLPPTSCQGRVPCRKSAAFISVKTKVRHNW